MTLPSVGFSVVPEGNVQAGTAASVKGEVKATTPPVKTAHQLNEGDAIFMGDKIETGADSRLEIHLLDQTVFSLGPLSTITVDEFVYDPENIENQGNVMKGLMRAVSSKVLKKGSEDISGEETSQGSGQDEPLKVAELMDAQSKALDRAQNEANGTTFR